MTISTHHTAIRAHCQPQPRSVWAKLGQLFAVRRQRQRLLQLDDHLLSDIGITRHEAYEEGRENMWNVPNHWRK